LNSSKSTIQFLSLSLNLQPKTKTTKQDGKPYILDVKAGPTVQDARNQGYTLAVTSVYASQADMDYYDNECAAHGELKKVVKTRVGGPPMVLFFENGV